MCQVDAAYSLQMEKEVGSIVPGKLANVTIFADNPIACDAAKIKDITVVATIHEGRILPVKKGQGRKNSGVQLPENFRPVAVASANNAMVRTALLRTSGGSPTHCVGGACSCATERFLSELLFPQTTP